MKEITYDLANVLRNLHDTDANIAAALETYRKRITALEHRVAHLEDQHADMIEANDRGAQA